MKIAIFGATSQIAKDLVLSFSKKNNHDLVLFARRPVAVTEWMALVGLSDRYLVANFESFTADKNFGAIINFVGSGNPMQTAAMGASIFDVTSKYDELALGYLHNHPDCRYIFLSSGAVYGSSFEAQIDENSKAVVVINNLQPQHWYGAAKLYAECRHRALVHLPIVDIRVFNYFSHTLDISARFFITDILRTIQSGEKLITSADNIVRDYLGPEDFYQLVSLILAAPPSNDVVDCFTKEPVDKMTLLSNMKDCFGLAYEVRNAPAGVNATGVKMNYFSKQRHAEKFGYLPTKNSLRSVMDEARIKLYGEVKN